MSPVLANLVTQAGSIQRMGADNVERANAFLLSALGNSIFGQTPVLAVNSSLNAGNAQTIAAAFQGMTQEQFFDVLTYCMVTTIQRLNSLPTGPVTTGQLSNDGFTLNNLVNGFWGGPNGVVDAQVVDSLFKYGTLIQYGADLRGL